MQEEQFLKLMINDQQFYTKIREKIFRENMDAKTNMLGIKSNWQEAKQEKPCKKN